jgi:hypothetical protein
MNLEKLNYATNEIRHDVTTIELVPTITCNTKYNIFDGIEKAILKATNDTYIQRKKIINKRKLYCITAVIFFISCVILVAVIGTLFF